MATNNTTLLELFKIYFVMYLPFNFVFLCTFFICVFFEIHINISLRQVVEKNNQIYCINIIIMEHNKIKITHVK